jgi:TusA-related sulfurtransferase
VRATSFAEVAKMVLITEDDAEKIAVDLKVDARGQSCPGPMLEAKKGLTKIKSGQTIELLSSDPGSRNDFEFWCKRKGNIYLGCFDTGGYDRHFIRKK